MDAVTEVMGSAEHGIKNPTSGGVCKVAKQALPQPAEALYGPTQFIHIVYPRSFTHSFPLSLIVHVAHAFLQLVGVSIPIPAPTTGVAVVQQALTHLRARYRVTLHIQGFVHVEFT